MNLRTIANRYPGIVSFGKIVGILFLVAVLASFFVLERYSVARVAMDVDSLEKEVSRIRQNKEYLQSKVSRLESLETISSIAGLDLGLHTPSPEQIQWIDPAGTVSTAERSIASRVVSRIEYLCAVLPGPLLGLSSASAEEATGGDK